MRLFWEPKDERGQGLPNFCGIYPPRGRPNNAASLPLKMSSFESSEPVKMLPYMATCRCTWSHVDETFQQEPCWISWIIHVYPVQAKGPLKRKMETELWEVSERCNCAGFKDGGGATWEGVWATSRSWKVQWNRCSLENIQKGNTALLIPWIESSKTHADPPISSTEWETN